MSDSSNKQVQKNGVDENGNSNGNERSVTDPVTHQPVQIHDVSKVELEQLPPPPTVKDEKEAVKADDGHSSYQRHQHMDQLVHEVTEGNWWEDPLGDQRRTRVQTSLVAGASAGAGLLGVVVLYWTFNGLFRRTGGWGVVDVIWLLIGCVLLGVGVTAASVSFRLVQEDAKTVPDFQDNKHKDILGLFEHNGNSDKPETVAWLNSLLKSLWPIVNPSLFVSIADMLEDSLQSTLPSFITGVRVADLGQGSEPVRILGIRWLDAGAAAKDVDGMKAEEGDFINMEVSLAYRAKETTGKGLRSRSANAHVLMEFFLNGGVRVPVWVELTGFLAVSRLRIQLMPNPPFLSVTTITLLGLPKVSLKCIPLAKNFLNVMDVPFLSNLISSSINAVTAEYVAPKSITLDLKTLLAGRPKLDTDSMGVLIITVRSAIGFDTRKSLVRNPMGKGRDLYVTLGWSKWGKPLWSTRIIEKEGSPVWEETTALLVGPNELNAQEGVMLQVWDSDRFTADDYFGKVEIPLTELISNEETHNRIKARTDDLRSDRGEQAQGTVFWEIGYFEKTTLEQHLEKKHQDYDEVKANIEHEAERELREAMAAGEEKKDEVEQQKKEDLKDRGDEIIAASAPTKDWPSGVLSVRVEQISGLEVEKVRESGVPDDAEEDESDDMPSAYCEIIMNHQRVYKSRTKMKNNNPYFDAGTEKFVRDWKKTTVIIAVRDSRIHESDPILGIVVLPLQEVLKHRSQWMGSLPIVGGVGYGRMRLSLTFRSIQLHLPKRLLGWDVGTIDIVSPVKATIQMPTDFANCKMVFHTQWGKGKMKPRHEGGWSSSKGRPIRLPVKKRYSSCLTIELRKTTPGPDQVRAYATLWLKDIPDDEEIDVSIPICKNDPNYMLEHASANATTDIGGEEGADYGKLEFRMKFWSGLSGYHHAVADGDRNMAAVMEVLDCAEGVDRLDEQEFPEEEGFISDSSDEDSDSGSKSSSERTVFEEEEGHQKDDTEDVDPLKKVGKKPKGAFKDFRKKQGDLHRRHRGLMQWGAARKMAWIGRGVEDNAKKLGDKVVGGFKHKEKENDVETEV